MNYFYEYEIFGSLFLPVSIDLHHESDVEPLKDHLLSAGYGDRFLSDFRSEAVFVFKVCLCRYCNRVARRTDMSSLPERYFGAPCDHDNSVFALQFSAGEGSVNSRI